MQIRQFNDLNMIQPNDETTHVITVQVTVGHFILRRDQSLKLQPEIKVWVLINMQNILNHVSDRSSHLTGKRRKNVKFLAFGPWRLLHRPKLRHHSRRICFVHICLSESRSDLV